MPTGVEILNELGAKPSISEENGLRAIRESDLMIFSPGISTAGFAEIRMAQANPKRKIIATTIDEKGLRFAQDIITQVGLEGQIETRLEDLRDDWKYPEDYFDFIYARLVLHYLSRQDLDKVLAGFSKSTKQKGIVFIVVRSEKNVDRTDPNIKYDADTNLTTTPHYGEDGGLESSSTRYFHTVESISEHVRNSGLSVEYAKEYKEQLYKDFLRREISPNVDIVIELVAKKDQA